MRREEAACAVAGVAAGVAVMGVWEASCADSAGVRGLVRAGAAAAAAVEDTEDEDAVEEEEEEEKEEDEEDGVEEEDDEEIGVSGAAYLGGDAPAVEGGASRGAATGACAACC